MVLSLLASRVGCETLNTLDQGIAESIQRSWRKETIVAVLGSTLLRNGPGTEYPVICVLRTGGWVVALGTVTG